MTAVRRKRVVMLVRNAYTHDSRVEKEAGSLTAAGHDVTVVADARTGFPERERRSGVDVVRVARTGHLPGVRFVLHQRRLARVLRALRPDVLHAHDSNALVPVALAARAAGVPYVYDAHDLWLGRPRRERSRLYFALNQLFYAFVERLLVRRAAATITVSGPIARHLETTYGLERVVLVPNYPERPLTERFEIRGLPGAEDVPENAPIVLYIGGLMAGRGLEPLVDACADVEEAHLVLLGEGVLAEPLRARAVESGADDRLHIVRPISPDRLVPTAASATIGVSPIIGSCLNYRYSLPNKLFQYMAAAIPVVASNFPQVRDVIDRAGCGLSVDTSRSIEIAAAIRTLLADHERARAMGERGRRAVDETFNWSTSAAALLDVYASLP